MTYIINPIWFYLMDVCGGLGVACGIIGACLLIIGGTAGLLCGWLFFDPDVDGEDNFVKKGLKIMKKCFIIGGICILLACVIPTKDGVTKMMISSVVTYENVETVKGDAKELVDYITEKALEVKGNETQEDNK